MNFRFTRRLTAAVVLAAAVGPGLTLTAGSAPAAAATCSTTSGVSVLVDFKELGGGIQGTCVANGGGQRASSLFPTAGFPLTYVQNEPGFVCRVSAKPAQDPCVDTPPTDAYWGLWWSDGKNGVWNYANYGASALKVPAGSSVAFAWKQGGGSASAPGVAPAVHQAAAPTKAPTKKPSTKPSTKPGKQPSKPSKQPSKAATEAPAKESAPQASAPAETAATSATPSESATPSGAATPTPTDSASAAAEATDAAPTDTSASPTEISEPEVVPAAEQTTEDGGVPTWLVVAMLVTILGAIGAVAVHRRRSTDSSGP